MLRLGAVWWCGGYLLYILLLMNGPEQTGVTHQAPVTSVSNVQVVPDNNTSPD